MGEVVEVTISEGIAEVTLNRPDKKNALSPEMFEALPAAGERLKAEKGLRAVILTGAGDSFCSGIDTSSLAAFGAELEATRDAMLAPGPAQANRFQRPCTVWAELAVPVIAAIRGWCLGGGLQIALGADIRIAHPEARLSIREVHWGIIPDMGITQALPKLMRADQAKLLTMTARIIEAPEAERLGLVTLIDEDPLAAARALAAELADRSPDALAGAKRLIDETWTMRPGEGLRREAEIQARLIGSPNQVEAVMSGMQKRKPVWK